MDGFLDYFDKLKKYAAYPVLFVSAALIAVYAASLFNLDALDGMTQGVKDFAPVMFGTVFCAFTVYYACRSIRKAMASVVCLLSADAVLFCSVGVHISFLYCVALTVLFRFVSDNAPMLYAFLICLAAGVLLSVAFALINDSYNVALKVFAESIKGRGALFGALSNPFNLLFGSGFDELFYTKSYGATVVSNGKIVTGAADIFRTLETPQRSAAQYLCGRYFATIFIPLGVFASLYKKLEKELLFAFLFSLVLSVLFGDERLFYMMLLLVSPLIYVGSAVIIYIAYAVSSFIDMRIGFTDGAGIIELVQNMQKPVYFALTALLISVLSYFLSRLISEKFGVLSENTLPRSVVKLVSSLGGEENILEIRSGAVMVANPNLIDVLRLDCDIHENRVSLLPDDFEILRSLTK